MAARVLAGAFGGPATSIANAIIADSIPAERRGKALGAVMGAFAVASVLGVPAGLEIAAAGGWRAPFFAVAALGVVIATAAVALLPPLRDHLGIGGHRPEQTPFVDLVRRPVVLLSWAMTASLNLATFTIAPNLAAYFLLNLQYPRPRPGQALPGGRHHQLLRDAPRRRARRSLRLVPRRRGGHLLVRRRALHELRRRRSIAGHGVPVIAIFLGFMLSNSLRGVPHNTLTSRVPSPPERARFMSIQSAVQHLASSLGAFFSAYLLHERPRAPGSRRSRALDGMPTVAALAMGLAFVFPLLAWGVEALVKARSARAVTPAPASLTATPHAGPHTCLTPRCVGAIGNPEDIR